MTIACATQQSGFITSTSVVVLPGNALHFSAFSSTNTGRFARTAGQERLIPGCPSCMQEKEHYILFFFLKRLCHNISLYLFRKSVLIIRKVSRSPFSLFCALSQSGTGEAECEQQPLRLPWCGEAIIACPLSQPSCHL